MEGHICMEQKPLEKYYDQTPFTEMKKKPGQLKIYFGYAAGVGKTYAMLNDAQEAKKDGFDVVIGYVEPHDRPETSALMEGLEKIPSKILSYKHMELEEFNLDLALKRQPDLIIVDELAHTNAQGSRHKKRFQDIEELLRAGIHVYTTVNVQHIESLNDQVSALTGVSVRERIPDRIFDLAEHIEVVDIEPVELIDRLRKGRIYQQNKVASALSNFFTQEKLVALREIALRRTADHINKKAAQELGSLNKSLSITNEHILVCLSGSPSNAKVIRAAARMAQAFNAKLTALYVETSDMDEDKNSKYHTTLQEHIKLAEDLGGQVATVYGDELPKQIVEYARASRVSKIVLGRTNHPKGWRPKQSFVDKLITYDPNIDLYIIPDNQVAPKWMKRKRADLSVSLIELLKSFFLLTISTLIGIWFYTLNFSEANIIIVYILGILVNAIITTGRKYSIISSLLSVIVYNFTFTEPRFTLKVNDPSHLITFLIMFIAALITSTLTKRVTEQAKQSAEKAYYTEVLLETSQKLQKTVNASEIYNETAQQLIKLLNRSVIFYPSKEDQLIKPLFYPHESFAGSKKDLLNDHEEAVAQWAFLNNKRAGAGTSTLSNAKCLYLVIRGRDAPLAVVGIVLDKDHPLGVFEKSLMIAMLDECALALDKEKANESQKALSIEMEQEKLRSNLLRAISHDLRLPLTSISGNVSILKANSDNLNEQYKQDLYEEIYDDSVWLINLIENLLSVTRIDNGAIHLKSEPELLEEVIAEALLHIDSKAKEHSIIVDLNDDLLMAKMDAQLIIQVFVNILNNAIRYTPAGSEIKISARKDKQLARIEISDTGNGIPDAEKEKLFDMFYTTDSINSDGRRGLGLGLFLCKSIIEAHQGQIYVKDNIPQGTILGFTLQAVEVSLYE